MPGEDLSINLIIAGVGGQGNVLCSVILAEALMNKGLNVTVGETYGASQRGGAVMSHVRASAQRPLPPIIPRGMTHVIMALEPVEAIRVLSSYGHRAVAVLVNTRPVYPVDVTSGQDRYPSMEEIRQAVEELSDRCVFVDATQKALQLGDPILTNIIMIGALVQLGWAPLGPDDIRSVLSERFKGGGLSLNIRALEEGMAMIEDKK
jgi:indolepyruvate ferredoxin oxidoreductase beta subunit